MTEHSTHLISSDKPIVTVSSVEYRDAMSHFAGAVHIVTTNGAKNKRGVTISACCSLSDNPPTVLVCLMRQHEENRIFIENEKFCVNTLAGHHRNLSDIFAGRGGITQQERFSHGKWQTLKTGSPVLSDALVALDCQLVGWHVHATHYVLIGEVVAVKRNAGVDALMYLDRAYRTLPLL
ncbi:flavin reductase [uncultured Bartonella sp.]|uniref:flavin reductase n=1 Tax=uncultured Bartonella sp. TaxID=104108 RepID=UPI0026003891|nr:flavin reductase [uncultured Bartonella sp.]